MRDLPPETRRQAADQIRLMRDFNLPRLDYFNDTPCDVHPSLEDGQQTYPPCRACGIRFRKHQKVGIAWLFMRGSGLIADQVGTGKSAQAAGLIACCKQTGELDGARAVVICRPAALDQWVDELRRFLPALHIVPAAGPMSLRAAQYGKPFDVLVIGHQMFLRDQDHLDTLAGQTGLGVLVIDDVDELRSHTTQTAHAIKRVARRSPRVVVLTGTPLQKRLHELHSVCELIGGIEVFGSLTRFKRQYVREELVKVWNKTLGRYVTTKKATGYQNLDDFVTKFAPMTLRRTPEHIDDVELPVITPHTVYLDLYPKQRDRYTALRKGVLKILAGGTTTVRHAEAGAAFTYGQQICAGLCTLGEADGPGTSVKLDWTEHAIVDGDLGEEKVVVFCHNTATVEALTARLDRAGVGTAVIWGKDTNRARRAEARTRFWDDPACRVFIGTDAIEQSLNLQVSRHLICLDQLMNPARMTQLAGRIRRDGSAYKTVYVHNLLARDTQEEGYLRALAREQALADHVWNESSQLYEALNPIALLELIGRRHHD